MTKTILIHANCTNLSARGDFVFAANLAKDIKQEFNAQGINDINIILVSPLDSKSRFTEIYGEAIDGCLMVDGISIGLSALEEFDAVENSVIAFIDANRCKLSSAELVKRVLSPDSKILFIGNANHQSYADLRSKTKYLQQAKRKQPNLYEAFNEGDILIASAGLGDDRLGIPTISKTCDLPLLSIEDQSNFPKSSYGFMYLSLKSLADFELIAQYIKLSNKKNYVLVGGFMDKKITIQKVYDSDTSLKTFKTFPNIQYYQSLPNVVMRHLIAQTPVPVILSTGVTSTLEVMRDKKLPFYQYFDINNEFVVSYLMAVKSVVSNDGFLTGIMADSIIELSNLLFAKKPLIKQKIERTQDLLNLQPVCAALITKNQVIIDQASGKISTKLLSFLNGERTTKDSVQLANVCLSLRKPGEMGSPVYDEALRRAAKWGRLFELKVIMNNMLQSNLNKTSSMKGHTALHEAVLRKNFDCTLALIRAGVGLNLKNNDGQTPLHLAIKNADHEMIKILIEAGASPDIQDNNNYLLHNYASDESAAHEYSA